MALWALWSRTQEPSAPGGAFKGGLHPQGDMVPIGGGKANRRAAAGAPERARGGRTGPRRSKLLRAAPIKAAGAFPRFTLRVR
jgi:hypothetical protein